MKLLVVGCGSIGQRRARNAQILGAEVALCDIDEARMRAFGSPRGITEYYQGFRAAAEKSGAAAAVVATPTHLHAEPAIALIEAGIPVLMEKPLAASLEDARRIERHVRKRGVTFMMGHTYRFRDEWIAVRERILKGQLGPIYSAELTGGSYLPDWHVREDYRREYAARRAQGGGVLLTSMSHLFDIARWFFGEIEAIMGVKARLGGLEIDVDDYVACMLKMKDGVAVTILENFLCRLPRRQLRINAEHGSMEADFVRKELRIWDAREKRFHPDDPAGRAPGERRFRVLEDGVAYDPEPDVIPLEYSGNDAYLKELEYFFDLVNGSVMMSDLDIAAGIKVLEAITHPALLEW